MSVCMMVLAGFVAVSVGGLLAFAVENVFLWLRQWVDTRACRSCRDRASEVLSAKREAGAISLSAIEGRAALLRVADLEADLERARVRIRELEAKGATPIFVTLPSLAPVPVSGQDLGTTNVPCSSPLGPFGSVTISSSAGG